MARPTSLLPDRLRAALMRLLALACALALFPAQADSDGGVQAGVAWLANPGHAVGASSRSSDTRGDLAADWNLRRYPSDFDTLALQLSGEAAQFLRHPGLDRAALGLQISASHAGGLGPGQPWVRISAQSAHDWYRDALRDGWRFRVALAAGLRANADWDFTGDVHAERRTQDRALADEADLPGTVYAQGRQGFDLASHWVFAPDWLAGLGWHWLRGDFDAVIQGDLDSYGGVAAYAADPAFGSEAYGYRFRALSQGIDLLLSRALDRQSSLSLLLRCSRTVAAAGAQYPDTEVGVVYAWRP